MLKTFYIVYITQVKLQEVKNLVFFIKEDKNKISLVEMLLYISGVQFKVNNPF